MTVGVQHIVRLSVSVGGRLSQAPGILSNRAGKNFPCNYVPEDEARNAMLRARLPHWLAELIIELFCIIRSAAVTEPLESYQRLTGQRPTTFERCAADYRDRLPQFV